MIPREVRALDYGFRAPDYGFGVWTSVQINALRAISCNWVKASDLLMRSGMGLALALADTWRGSVGEDTTEGSSLADDPGFLAALDDIDHEMEPSRGSENIGRGPVGEDTIEGSPVADDPGFVAALDDLDRGVLDARENAAAITKRPPLVTRLVIPGTHGPQRLSGRGSATARAPERAAGFIGAWVASWIILAMFLGAAAAGFTFHVQLSQIVVQWEAQRQ